MAVLGGASIDSLVCSVYFAEAHAEWAAQKLVEHGPELRMSTVNLTETLIRVRDRQPQLADEIEENLLQSGIRFVAPDVRQARTAAEARLRYPLNLGDCFAYALAVAEDCALLVLDRQLAPWLLAAGFCRQSVDTLLTLCRRNTPRSAP
ncbi:MAG: type II toxin-antitoxin system VapC family toxin [bacterium]|nr:type II toxin-antitoxin system VapC family toxin [bacterium]